ncbi:MAG: nuclear transport factor 2 family protein [Bacteriovoracaceae bacterium]
MNKKQIAMEFLKLAGSGKVKEAYDQFIAPEFIHHNQYFKGDRQSLLKAMESAHQSSPNKSIETKFAIEEGDKVMTYSHVVKDKMDIVVSHIFRFHGDKVVELWDVGQVIDKNSPNENGPF